MFGTFVQEEERPTYGLTKNVNTFNPVKIAFFEWKQMVKDVSQAGLTFSQRLNYIFAPPGWSHDGSRKTSSQLRAEAKAAKKGEVSPPLQPLASDAQGVA